MWFQNRRAKWRRDGKTKSGPGRRKKNEVSKPVKITIENTTQRKETISTSWVARNTTSIPNKIPPHSTSIASKSFTIESILSRPNPVPRTPPTKVINSESLAPLTNTTKSDDGSVDTEKGSGLVSTRISTTAEIPVLLRPVASFSKEISQQSCAVTNTVLSRPTISSNTPAENVSPSVANKSTAAEQQCHPGSLVGGRLPPGAQERHLPQCGPQALDEHLPQAKPQVHEGVHNMFVNFRTSSIQTLRYRAEEHVRQLHHGLTSL